jgi:hypothetical protein
MDGEIKIVVTLKEGGAMIGLQKHGCDPVFHKVEGELPVLLKSIPKLVEDTLAKWEQTPKYPKCQTDLTPPAPPPRAASRSARQTAPDQQALL